MVTGFHPELTEQENINLNETILGTTRRVIPSKIDEIVDFAKVEKFFDTAVKRCSIGMYVRLAYRFAAYLETKVYIDERNLPEETPL